MKTTFTIFLLCLLASSVFAQARIARPVRQSINEIKISKYLVPRVDLEKIKIQMGNAENELPKNNKTPRPDLAGLRLMHLTGDAVYLVSPEGYLQWIPNEGTYSNLFGYEDEDWDGIYRIDLINMPIGDPITHDADIFKGYAAGETLYLVSNGVKRGITGPAVMEKYHFDTKIKIEALNYVPNILLDFIPTGANWQ